MGGDEGSVGRKWLTIEERQRLRLLADHYGLLCDDLAEKSNRTKTAANEFFNKYCNIGSNEFTGIDSGYRYGTAKLDVVTLAEARTRVAKLARLDPDLPRPVFEDKAQEELDQKLAEAFDLARAERDTIAKLAQELHDLLRRLPQDIPADEFSCDAPKSALLPAPAPSQPLPLGSAAAEPVLSGYHSPSELGDFVLHGFPMGNRDSQGGAPLLSTFEFHKVPIYLKHGDVPYELRVNSGRLSLRLNQPTRPFPDDRTVTDDLDGKLRIKRVGSKLNLMQHAWLIEHPDNGAQLDGSFPNVALCYVLNPGEAKVTADLWVTAGQIAVWYDGKRLARSSPQTTLAERVVAQWAIWCGLGVPADSDPVYLLGNRTIGDDEDE